MTLAAKTVEILDDLPPYLAADRSAQATLDPVGRELQRLEDTMVRLRHKMLPQNADDEFRTLGMHELLLGLPVEPAGMSVPDRVALVLLILRLRGSGAASDWVGAATKILGLLGTDWTWELGPGPYTLTITLPISGPFSAGRALVLLRPITPAHIDLHTGYGGGFIVGISTVGIESL